MNASNIDSPETSSLIEAACNLFARIAPDIAPQIAPLVERLFLARASGDTFIYVNTAEAEILAQAAPIVGTDARSPLVWHNRRLFLAKDWHIERELATQIQRIAQHECQLPPPENITPRLQTWFADAGSIDQQAACTLALVKSFVLISGGPGTGKTTTVAKLLALLCDHKLPLPRIALVAPTGKAAARLSQALHGALTKLSDVAPHISAHLHALEGQTVHRLLGITPPRLLPEYDAKQHLPVDIILIDEASMLDNHLFLQLLSALPAHCRVIILGDAEQLPSVGAGAVLAALTQDSELTDSTRQVLQTYLPERSNWDTVSEQHARLTHSHRFHAQSGIGQLAHALRTGSLHTVEVFEQFPDELHLYQGNVRHLAHALWAQHTNYWQAIDTGDVQAAFTTQNHLMILTALRHDAARVNQTYRQVLQQHGRAPESATWFAGQMLLITRNAPTQKLYNGDVGIVMQPAQSDGLVACFADDEHGYRSIPLSRLPEHETAFAMTVHKSQGSEYNEVWYLAPQVQTASRALLYTAITRAKQRFVYWGDNASIQAACAQHEVRHSALATFLQHNQRVQNPPNSVQLSLFS